MSPQRLQLGRREHVLDPPQANARGSWTRRSTLELTLHSRGLTGRGEAAPLPDYSPDSMEDGWRALEALAAQGPSWIETLDFGSPRALLSAAASALPAELPAARFALETALLDLAGQRSGQPIWRLLAGLVPGSGKPGAIGVCALLPSADPHGALALARRGLCDGVRVFKLKVGPERLSAAQQATLERLRGELGDGVSLRLDANRSLARSHLTATLEAISRQDVEFLEEPLDAPTCDELRGSPCPLALDESLQGLPEAELVRWLSLDSVRVVVLKPTALGGFAACIGLALAARARGREAVVSHALEGPLGWAACAHLALALQGSRAAGLWPLAHQSAASPQIVRGQLLPEERPGLGANA